MPAKQQFYRVEHVAGNYLSELQYKIEQFLNARDNRVKSIVNVDVLHRDTGYIATIIYIVKD